MRVAITCDVEQDIPPYLDTWRGIEEGLKPFLDLLRAEGVTGTFFTTGESAERYPEAVRSIVQHGHELAGHGYTHRAFTSMTRDEARSELTDSATRLREFGPVTSFRAPYLKFPDPYLDLLVDTGFQRDSSQAKYKVSYRRSRSHPTPIPRVPVSMTSSVLRLAPRIRNPWLGRLRSPVVLFVHPWEFVDFRRAAIRLDCRFKTGAVAIECLREVITLFRDRHAEFVTVESLAPA